jgi:hypothetical protein
MKRGIRQGCPLSALLFLLVVEILAIMIRESEDIKGIIMGNNEHKIVQYADDATICLRDLQSINKVIQIINTFSTYAGLKLNINKTKGIWLGSLKDLGLLRYQNITWTGNPVKLLGIYLGHNKDKCNTYNWLSKIEKMQKCLDYWKHRKLTLYGKVYVIKTYALSKIVFPASVLSVPNEIKKQIKDAVYTFLWGNRDRIKRTTIANDLINGGLNMIDIDSFLMSLKAAWVPRLINLKGKWADLFYWHCQQLKLPKHYIWKTTFKKVETCPAITEFPLFYQDIILSFNASKFTKPFNKLSKSEVVEQAIWGNEYFKVGNCCLYYKRWIFENICYVKDLVNKDGVLKSDDDMYEIIKDKRNILQELSIVKKYIMKRLKHIDTTIAPYVKIKDTVRITHHNQIHVIDTQKSKFFYSILASKCMSKGNMETLYSREFKFENNHKNWRTIYQQKLKDIKVRKLSEFNFKILHNIVPCGYVVSKWQRSVKIECEVCHEIESTKHMLYDCPQVNSIWKLISHPLNCDVSWKNIVCGFLMNNKSRKITALNFVIVVVAYTIFKENSHCKFNELPYACVNLNVKVKQNLMYYKCIMEGIHENTLTCDMLNLSMKKL